MSINAAPRITYEFPPGEGISCFTPESPHYRHTIQTLGPKETIDALAPILPYGVLIRNDSAVPVVAVRVAYRLMNAQGKPITSHFSMMTLWDHDPMGFVNPGQQVLMFPGSGLSRKVESAVLFSGAPLMWRSRELFESQESITISVDGVAFRNGIAVGPDRTGLVDTVNSYLAAREDIDREVLATSDEPALRQYLAEISKSEFGPGGVGHTDAYNRQKSQIAEAYLAHLSTAGEADLRQVVRNRQAVPKIGKLRKKGD